MDEKLAQPDGHKEVHLMMQHARAVTGLALCLAYISAVAQPPNPSIPSSVPGQVVVGFQPGAAGQARAEAHRQAGATPQRVIAAIDAAIVQVPVGREAAAIAAYESNPNVRYAEPNYLRLLRIPNEGNDPPLGIDYFTEQYGLNNFGQGLYYDSYTGETGVITGAVDADIDAPEAWDLDTGSPAVIVAVLDSGVDCLHADLIGKCIDEQNLGPSTTPDDLIGHGTHVAGIIGAQGDNGIGIAGVSWHTSIAALKVCYEYNDWLYGLIGLCDSAASADGITYAANMGYQVINMSYAGPSGSQAEADAAAYAWSRGTLLIAAAGNAYERAPVYPANFPNVVAVAATDWYDNLASFSNFGSWVSLAAPGYNTFSTLPHALCGISQSDPEGCYGWMSGTSMASPTVAGAAALVWSYMGGAASNASVLLALESGADATGALGQNMLAWTAHGRLNLRGALDAAAAGGGGGGGGGGSSAEATSVHVGDLDATKINSGSTVSIQVTVEVHYDTEALASGAIVSGNWTGGYQASNVSCQTPTNGSGRCVVASGPIPKRIGSATFTVTGVTDAGGLPYDAVNHDPDGDSNGTTIAVVK
jgi:thermitase